MLTAPHILKTGSRSHHPAAASRWSDRTSGIGGPLDAETAWRCVAGPGTALWRIGSPHPCYPCPPLDASLIGGPSA